MTSGGELGEHRNLSTDTLLPFPEMNFSFELLELEVQLADRLSRVSLYTEQHRRTTASELADELQTTTRWVNNYARSIGITPEDTSGGHSDYTYDPMSATVIQEEWWWVQAYETMDEDLSSDKIAQTIARSKKWVKETAADLLVFPRLADERRLVYPKTLVPLLRHIDLVTSPRDGWLTVSEIAEIVQHDESTVRRWLESAGLVPEWRRSHTDGRTLQRYPDDTLDLVWSISAERVRAGTWRTLTTMARELGVDLDWVRVRIELYAHLAEPRVDDSGKQAQHYPEEVYEALKAAHAEHTAVPFVADDELTLSDIARTLNMARESVRLRLTHLRVEPISRRTTTNRIVGCYKDTILTAIAALPRDLRRP